MAQIDTKDASVGFPFYKIVDPVGDTDIIKSWSPPPRIVGGTILAGTGKLAAGTILGRVTTSGKHVQFLDTLAAAAGGVPVGVLRHAVDASVAADGDKAGEIITVGILDSSEIVVPTDGTIAKAIAITGNLNVFKNARVDTVREELHLF